MKKLLATYQLYITVICLFFMISCKEEISETTSSTKENMDSKSKTIENMQSAYKGEKTATAKYEAFATKADEEGYHNISILYHAVSAAESIHAANHKMVIEDSGATVPEIIPEYEVKTTKENLDDDINGEAFEAQTMYPDFLKSAESANNQIASLSLTYAMKTEAKHNLFFKQALSAIKNDKVNSLPSQYSVCPACGNTYSDAPGHCDFSLTSREKFIKFQ